MIKNLSFKAMAKVYGGLDACVALLSSDPRNKQSVVFIPAGAE